MRLRRIDVERLPGGDASFRLDGLAPGLNIIVGPNGSGKSSLCRAIQATLFGAALSPPGSELVTHWESGEGDLRAELSSRGVRWQRAGVDVDAPRVPSGHLASVYRLGLRDLLAPDHPGDEALADQIRIEIAGGFDLARVRRKPPGARFAEKEGRALQEARRSLLELRGERRRLAEEEQTLQRHQRELEAARSAQRLAQAMGRAVELAASRDSLAALDAEILGLGVPEAVLERMTGHELEDLGRMDEELAACADELREAQGRLRRAEGERAAAELPDGPLSEESLKGLHEFAEALRRSDDTCRRLSEEHAGASKQLREAMRALGADGDAGDPVSLDAGDLEALVAIVERRLELGEQRLRAEAELSSVSGVDPEVLSAELERLRRGTELLREWLAGPEPRPRIAVSAGVLLVLVTAAGAAAGYLVHPGGYAATGLGLGALLALLWSGRGGSPHRLRRADLEARWQELELGAPQVLERDAVHEALARLDVDLARSERRLQDHIVAASRRRGLDEIDRRDGVLRTQAEALRAQLGIDPSLGAASVADLLVRIRGWREATAAEAAAAGRLDEARSQREAAAQRIAQATGREFGIGAEAARVLAAVAQLDERCQGWRVADRRADDQRDAVQKIEQRAAGLHGQRAAVLARCALEPLDDAAPQRAELETRLALRARYVERSAERRTCGAKIEELRESLAEHPDLLRLSAQAASARREELVSRAEGLEEIAARIGDIQGRIRAASSGAQHEDRAADVDAAHDALLDRRDELADTLIAGLVLDEIEREHEQQARPDVVQRARESFARYTHQRYDLLVEHAEGTSRFRALETTTGRGLSLSELSDGTRMQLLLAARLAFATGAERGAPLPLFLDEALTASDPERFRAVSEGLLDLTASGRQVFYLTCNPTDAQLFEDVCGDLGAPPPHVVDLGLERGAANSVLDPERLRAPASRPVPSADGVDAAEYGRRLAVPRPDPFAPSGRLHLFHVLRDDLPVLHRLLAEARIEQVGQWRMLCETRVARQLLAADEIRRVEEGVGLAECLLAAWRIGRGRPVDRAILETSDAISETFIEPMVALAAECGGRADRLMAALEGDRRPKRFRAEKCEELRVHLIEAGCLDERAPLDAEGLWVRTLRDLSRRMQELAVGGSEGREAGDDGGGGADGSPLELARLRRTFDALLAAIGEPPLRDGASKESE